MTSSNRKGILTLSLVIIALVVGCTQEQSDADLYTAYDAAERSLIESSQARLATSDSTLNEIARYYNPRTRRHAYTVSLNEHTAFRRAGFRLEGWAFKTYVATSDSCSVPLYRCLRRHDGDFFLSTDSNCEGYLANGSAHLGYICAESQEDEAENDLVRFRCGPVFGHLSSTNDAEIARHDAATRVCTNEGIQGYTP